MLGYNELIRQKAGNLFREGGRMPKLVRMALLIPPLFYFFGPAILLQELGFDLAGSRLGLSMVPGMVWYLACFVWWLLASKRKYDGGTPPKSREPVCDVVFFENYLKERKAA